MWQHPRQRADSQRGFTLVEIGITVAILALAAAVILPGMNNVTRADLRKAASGVNTTVRSAYDSAALSGQTYRLVFTPGKSTIVVQSTPQTLVYDDKTGAFGASVKASNSGLDGLDASPFDEEDETEFASKQPPSKDDKKSPKEPAVVATPKSAEGGAGGGVLAGLLGINKLGAHDAAVGFTEVGKYDLGERVHILDIWTDGMEQPMAQGEAYLYFFPSGYTQQALVHLEDAEKRIFTVKVSPLTGRCVLEDKYVGVPK